MKLYDEIFTWSGLHGTNNATVRVRVFNDARKNETKAIVVLTEPPDNAGTSVTNGIEQIAGRVLKDRGFWIDEVTIIEHYPAGSDGRGATFDVVTFIDGEQTVDHFGGLMFKGPTWYRISPADVAEMIRAENVGDVERDRF